MSVGDRVALATAALLRPYPFRGKTFVWNQVDGWLAPGSHTVTMPGGGRMLIDTRRYWQRKMLAACFERRGVWMLRQLLGAGDAFIDGGANCGYFSCIAAGLVGPRGQVVAVEADQRLIDQLNMQATLNPTIRVEHAALTRAAGDVTFHLPPDLAGGYDLALASVEPHDGWRQVRVPATTIDAIVAALGRTVRLLKLDIEGHEGPALEGARASLASGQLESVVVEIRESTAAVSELMTHGFDLVLDVPGGFVPVDPRTFVARDTDLLFLRGESYRRWRASAGWARWI